MKETEALNRYKWFNPFNLKSDVGYAEMSLKY